MNKKLKVALGVVGALAALGFLVLVIAVVYVAAHADDLAFLRSAAPTHLIGYQHEVPSVSPPTPPADLELIRFPAPLGSHAAYATPVKNDGRRRPAVVWAKGGAGGIGDFLWRDIDPENDQSGRAFRERDIVVMYPSWRGENDNPGFYEMFFGEVDDLLAARDYVRARPDVDPERIYLVGHSTGATVTLLASIMDDGFRAAVCFGPWLALPQGEELAKLDISGFMTPFNANNTTEVALRSAWGFLHRIRRPTWYVEGIDVDDVAGFQEEAAAVRTETFQLIVIPGGDHFNILHTATTVLADKIATSPDGEISLTQAELSDAWRRAHPSIAEEPKGP